MKYRSANEIRQLWLDFFKSKDHQVVPPANLIPVDDPTLLWINSGVATLKKYFDGSEIPENPRLTNSQKSIRTNDIENVGKTARHHTLFEMLGNFSIGDYFKEEAIVWAWEFLVSEEWLGLDPDRLSVTIYPEDEEAKQIWMEKVGLPEERIIPLEDNFWDIGEGPCGPNTEIFYDRGQEYNDLPEDHPESFPGGENERWLEIWNIVFSQFNHMPDGSYEELPNKNIDTGMGLERIASVIQDTPTNFETDLFSPLLKEIEEYTGKDYIQSSEDTKTSFKIIADHARAVTMAIADGALPGNEGRGYIIRRLIRRSVVHGHKLGINEPFIYKLVPVVGDIMGDFYPEVLERQDFVMDIIEREESRFHQTLEDGLSMLEELFDQMDENGDQVIDGAEAFKFYDTYGFPFELTQEFGLDHGFKVDVETFNKEMEAQRQRGRAARSAEGSMAVQSNLANELTGDTDFLGYTESQAVSELTYMVKDNQLVDEAKPGDRVQVIFEQTPFYAEKGGQVGDTGWIYNEAGEELARVLDTQSAPAGQELHELEVTGNLKTGESYQLVIDLERRKLIRRNHTATHLLHAALHNQVGDHANQAGSLVAPDVLRFDFTHFEPLTPEQLQAIEDEVNEKIWEAHPVVTTQTTIDRAKEMGAIALFGEKYGRDVRVVQVDGDYSMELCGGTHVPNTSEIGLFKITQETGIGSGVRRIFAQTSKGAFEYLEGREEILKEAQDLLHAQTVQDVPERIKSLNQEIKTLESQKESMMSQVANAQAAEVLEKAETFGDYSVTSAIVNVETMDQLRQIADDWKQNDKSDILVLGMENQGKANLLVAMNDKAIQEGLKSGDLIKEIAEKIGGGGGGRPDLAQAGGNQAEGLADALEAAKEWIANH